MPAQERPTSTCGAYVCSKAGMLKVLVLIGGCVTFAIFAESRQYLQPRIKSFILASYIISWAISLMLYFFRITGFFYQMSTSCLSFDGFDYFWSWISMVNYLSMSVLLACYFGNCNPGCNGSGQFCPCAQQLTALLVGMVTAVLYGVEAQHLRLYAPVGTGYGTSWRGIWKTLILVVGGCAFGLLIQTGYRCSSRAKPGCDQARIFVLVAWCVAWGVSALMLLLHLLNFSNKITVEGRSNFGTFEFFWAAFSCLLYLLGSCVYAGFLNCTSFNSYTCRARLAADICGFVAAILFGIDAYQVRIHRPYWFFNSRPPPRG